MHNTGADAISGIIALLVFVAIISMLPGIGKPIRGCLHRLTAGCLESVGKTAGVVIAVILITIIGWNYLLGRAADFMEGLFGGNKPLTAVVLTSSPPSEQYSGQVIELTSKTKGGKKVQYKYLAIQKNGTAATIRDFDRNSDYRWKPQEDGAFQFKVVARDSSGTEKATIVDYVIRGNFQYPLQFSDYPPKYNPYGNEFNQFFGDNNDYSGQKGHLGVDLPTGFDKPVYAVSSGSIVKCWRDNNTNSGWGNGIIIEHDIISQGRVIKVYSLYAHLNRLAPTLKNRLNLAAVVKAPSEPETVFIGLKNAWDTNITVNRGDIIGYEGHTGACSGNNGGTHLHFEISDSSSSSRPGYSGKDKIKQLGANGWDKLEQENIGGITFYNPILFLEKHGCKKTDYRWGDEIK